MVSPRCELDSRRELEPRWPDPRPIEHPAVPEKGHLVEGCRRLPGPRERSSGLEARLLAAFRRRWAPGRRTCLGLGTRRPLGARPGTFLGHGLSSGLLRSGLWLRATRRRRLRSRRRGRLRRRRRDGVGGKGRPVNRAKRHQAEDHERYEEKKRPDEWARDQPAPAARRWRLDPDGARPRILGQRGPGLRAEIGVDEDELRTNWFRSGRRRLHAAAG